MSQIDFAKIAVGDSVRSVISSDVIITGIEKHDDRDTFYGKRSNDGVRNAFGIHVGDKVSIEGHRDFVINALESDDPDCHFVGLDVDGNEWDIDGNDLISHRPFKTRVVQTGDRVRLDNSSDAVFTVKAVVDGEAWIVIPDLFDRIHPAHKLIFVSRPGEP